MKTYRIDFQADRIYTGTAVRSFETPAEAWDWPQDNKEKHPVEPRDEWNDTDIVEVIEVDEKGHDLGEPIPE